MKVARARSGLLGGTWEPAIPIRRRHGRAREGDLQADETVRGRVPMRDAGTDRLVVAMKPANAGRAKGAGYPGLFGGQPQGRSR
jgi:hypothetical protein